jgi:hypothetical protein
MISESEKTQSIDYGISYAYGAFSQLLNSPVADMRNNVLISLKIKKKSLVWNPDFGMKEVSKMTPNAVSLVKEYATEALKWIIEAGRAKSIRVESFIALQDANRVDLNVWVDGQLFTHSYGL